MAFSGDTGFYSGAFTLRPLLESFCEVETLCGITTVQYLSSRCGIPWQDAHLVSAHGRACDPVAELLGHPSCFFLTDGQMTPKKDVYKRQVRGTPRHPAERTGRMKIGKVWLVGAGPSDAGLFTRCV